MSNNRFQQNKFQRTLTDLNNLADSEFIRTKTLNDFSTKELQKMKSDDLRCLYVKKLEEFYETCLKTKENLPNESVTRFEQSEVRRLTQKLAEFRDKCKESGLSVREFEEESVKFVTDKYKRFFFNSKLAQKLYNMNNAVASSVLGYWGYRAVGILGTTNRYLLQGELLKSTLPISFFTGVTFKFWSYILSPFPKVSKALDGMSIIALSPIWCVEYVINKIAAPFWRRSPVRVVIPLNITGHVASGSGLTWDKLNHTFNFVQNMTKTWSDIVES